MDSAVAQNGAAEDRKFYIIYEQLFRNRNPYLLFDENKPAWLSHTTLPHSLTAAMLNITRPGWPSGQEVSICDPFGGSGTTFLEASKHRLAQVQIFDKSASAIAVARDNVEIFGLSESAITEICDRITSFADQLKKGRIVPKSVTSLDGIKERRKEPLSKCVNGAKVFICDVGGDPLDATEELWLTKGGGLWGDLKDRIVFYIALRALMRHQRGISRGSIRIGSVLEKEARDLLAGFVALLRIRKSNTVLHSAGFAGKLSQIGLIEDDYSIACVPSKITPAPPNDLFGTWVMSVQDVKNLAQNRFDVVICDPPYGVNTYEDVFSMSDLYDLIVERIALAIKDCGGQVVIACPELTFTGRPIPPFVKPAFLMREFIRVCKLNGRVCYSPAEGVPGPRFVFQKPYYWYSEKVLRRGILHFWIRKAD